MFILLSDSVLKSLIEKLEVNVQLMGRVGPNFMEHDFVTNLSRNMIR